MKYVDIKTRAWALNALMVWLPRHFTFGSPNHRQVTKRASAKHDSKVNGTYVRLDLKSETTQILKHSCQNWEEIQHSLHDSWIEVFSPKAVHWSQHKSVQRELYWGFWSWCKLCL